VANNTDNNPWILDTAGVVTASPVSVSKIVFYPSATNDDLSIGHGDGSVVWITRAAAPASNNESVGQETMTFNPPVSFAGFKVNTIDGGRVYVYLNTLF
jgi:hypothetical protein